MTTLIAVYASPRRGGNTATLLKAAVAGARAAGASVEEFTLRDMKISPCLEIYACKTSGECAIKDDFQRLRDRILAADGLMLASPIFFYTVSAHAKMFMDRCQSLWVKKYWLDPSPPGRKRFARRGLFISAGATKGKKLFDGVLLTIRYFFDVFDMELTRTLLCRELDSMGAAQAHPEYIAAAEQAGRELVAAIEIE